MTIWFDMDGTIADLYGRDDWLNLLRASDTTPYTEAEPLLNMQLLARLLNNRRKLGYKIGVVSWTSKNSSLEYAQAVAKAKKEWLAKHLASVRFDYIDIIPYGTPKQNGRQGILFDDEKQNRDAWGYGAYDEKRIIEILKGLN